MITREEYRTYTYSNSLDNVTRRAGTTHATAVVRNRLSPAYNDTMVIEGNRDRFSELRDMLTLLLVDWPE